MWNTRYAVFQTTKSHLKKGYKLKVLKERVENQTIMPQRVYIGNVGSDIRERDIEKFFKGFGKLGEISLKQGYGFVDFEDQRDAEDACQELDGKDLRGSR